MKSSKRAKVSSRNWNQDEGAEALLSALIGENEGEAQREVLAKEEARRAAEAAKEEARRLEEAQRKEDASKRLAAEAARREEEARQREALRLALEREEKIANGEIDLEAERAQTLQEEARAQAEAQAWAAKEAALNEAQRVLLVQAARIEAFESQEEIGAVVPPSPVPKIVSVMALVVALLVTGFVLWGGEETTPQEDPYAVADRFPTVAVGVTSTRGPVAEIHLETVSQSGEAVKVIGKEKPREKRTKPRREEPKEDTFDLPEVRNVLLESDEIIH